MNERSRWPSPVTTVWTSPDAPRDLDAAAVRDRPDAAAWADSMDQEARLGLHGRTETQLLAGEPVEVLETAATGRGSSRRGSASSRDERGYPGWVRSGHLGTPVPAVDGRHRVRRRAHRHLPVDGEPVELSFGTVLLGARGHLGDGHGGPARRATGSLVPLDALRLCRRGRAALRRPGRRARGGSQFLGVRYLWGGTSAWGVDCSGLVHLCWRSRRACGSPATPTTRRRPPRRAGAAGRRAARRPVLLRPAGERIYHVGFVTRPVAADGTRWMLHAPEGGELVEDAPLAPHRLGTLVSAGRVRS